MRRAAPARLDHRLRRRRLLRGDHAAASLLTSTTSASARRRQGCCRPHTLRERWSPRSPRDWWRPGWGLVPRSSAGLTLLGLAQPRLRPRRRPPSFSTRPASPRGLGAPSPGPGALDLADRLGAEGRRGEADRHRARGGRRRRPARAGSRRPRGGDWDRAGLRLRARARGGACRSRPPPAPARRRSRWTPPRAPHRRAAGLPAATGFGAAPALVGLPSLLFGAVAVIVPLRIDELVSLAWSLRDSPPGRRSRPCSRRSSAAPSDRRGRRAPLRPRARRLRRRGGVRPRRRGGRGRFSRR